MPDKDEAALLAIGVTVVGYLISNQAKVSDFRQQWINALREDAATLISHTFTVHSAKAGEPLDDSYLQIHQASARIGLRLNPKEKKSKRVKLAMTDMRHANHTPDTEFSVVAGRVNEFLAAIQDVLKSEWRRVKWGEPIYRAVFLLVTGAAVFAIAARFYRYFLH